MSVSYRTGVTTIAVVIAMVLSGAAVTTASAVGGAATSSTIDDFQDQIEDKEAEEDQLQSELEDLENELEDTDQQIVEANRELQELEAQMPPLQEAYDEAEAKVQAAIVEQQRIADTLEAAEAQDRAISDEIAEDEERVAELQSRVAALALESYKGTDMHASLQLVFGSQSAEDFVNDFAAQRSAERVQSNLLAELESIAATNRNRGVRQEAVRDYIAELKVEADALVVTLEGLRDDALAAKKLVDDLHAEAQQVREYLEDKRAEVEAQQAQAAAQQQSVRDDIADLSAKKLEAEEEYRRQQQNTSSPPSNPTPLGKGVLAFPTAVPYVTSSYGMRVHPIYGFARLHAGTDFRAYCGTPIYASASGTVEWARFVPGFGNQVIVDHGIMQGNSLITSYNHLSRFSVTSGQSVSRGDIVGYSGTTGSSTACHLHFEVFVNGSTQNPMSLLGSIG